MVERAKRARFMSGLPQEKVDAAAVRLADNLHACSCGICCNPRRGRGLEKSRPTRQEERAFLDLEEARDRWIRESPLNP